LIQEKREAEEKAFFGSPTIKINGRDLEPEVEKLHQTGLG